MGIIVFASYATKDAGLFHIQELSLGLEIYKDIDEVLYWEEDAHDNITQYMDEYVGKCDIFILFCSPNALKSDFV